MQADERNAANMRTLRRLGIAAVGMFGFGFALVPLYNVFCDITGINGKTGRIEVEAALSEKVDDTRLVTVEFLGRANSDLSWEFKPLVRRVRVHPGEVTEVSYFARNRTEHKITAQAVPSLAPGQAAKYFNKTECFCFTRQSLEAGEGKEMPLRFIVDPELPEEVRTVSLSYTFFPVEDATTGIEQIGAASTGADSLEPIM